MQRPRYLTRSNTLTREREKRGLDSADGDDLSREPKRQKVPALARSDILLINVDLSLFWVFFFFSAEIGYFAS